MGCGVGDSGPGVEEIQDMHLRERVLLARTPCDGVTGSRCRVHGSRFCVLQDSENEQGVLGGEDSEEQGTR